MSGKKASPKGADLPPYVPPPPDPSVDLGWLPPDLQPGADLGDPNRPHWETEKATGEYAGKPEGITWGDFALVAGKPLSPGHRRICQLFAMGLSNKEVAEAVGFTEARIGVLRSNTLIVRETARLQEKAFEITAIDRMKDMGTAALDAIESAVKNETKAFKTSEQLSASQWVVEHVIGKAVQRHDVGENLLSILLDRLDSKKTAAPPVQRVIDVKALPLSEPEEETRDPLSDWVSDFAASSK